MDETSEPVRPVQNASFLKERQAWLELYESTCQQIGGTSWRQRQGADLFTKVESQLWQRMRAKGMHHATFWRKCRLAREALTPT
jgi:hypothetical protein